MKHGIVSIVWRAEELLSLLEQRVPGIKLTAGGVGSRPKLLRRRSCITPSATMTTEQFENGASTTPRLGRHMSISSCSVDEFDPKALSRSRSDTAVPYRSAAENSRPDVTGAINRGIDSQTRAAHKLLQDKLNLVSTLEAEAYALASDPRQRQRLDDLTKPCGKYDQAIGSLQRATLQASKFVDLRSKFASDNSEPMLDRSCVLQITREYTASRIAFLG